MRKLNSVLKVIGHPDIFNLIEKEDSCKFEFSDFGNDYALVFPGNTEIRDRYKNEHYVPMSINLYSDDSKNDPEIDEDANEDYDEIRNLFDIESHHINILEGISIMCYTFSNDKNITKEKIEVLDLYRKYILKSLADKLDTKRYTSKIFRNTIKQEVIQDLQLKVSYVPPEQTFIIKEESLFDKFKKTKIGKWIFGNKQSEQISNQCFNNQPVVQEKTQTTAIKEIPTYPLINRINLSIMVSNSSRLAKLQLGKDNREILGSINAILVFKIVDNDNDVNNDVQFYRIRKGY